MSEEQNKIDIILSGASARACAQSANLAKIKPMSIDIFNDMDTQDAGVSVRVTQYPFEVQKVMRDLPPAPWMYLGGMENYPKLIRSISEQHPLLGCSPESLSQVKSPFELQEHLSKANLPNLKISRGENPPLTGTWLKKPLISAGGQRISFYSITGRSSLEEPVDYYFQEYLSGGSISATCVAYPLGTEGEVTRGKLLGITRQLTGEVWCHAPTFVYCGSIGPLKLATESMELIQNLVDSIAGKFKLQGLFGLDLVLDSNGIPHVVEVNPRYTASMELYERQAGSSLLEIHATAFGWDGKLPLNTWLNGLNAGNKFNRVSVEFCDEKCTKFISRLHSSQGMIGKTVLYATNPMTVKPNWNWDDFLSTVFSYNKEENVYIADRPRAGIFVGAGDPVCTLLSKGETETHTYDLLRRKSVLLHQYLMEMW